MHTCVKISVFVILTQAISLTRATEWDHYQVILERHPFGTLKDATNNLPDYAKGLRLSAIWQIRGQPRAGFEDAVAKRDFVLSRGETSEDGLELMEVHMADESVVIRKGAEVATMHIQAGASTNAQAMAALQAASSPGTAPNPWREFYERYRQRRQQEGGGNPAQPPSAPGGTSGQIETRLDGQPIQIQTFRIEPPAAPTSVSRDTGASDSTSSRSRYRQRRPNGY